MQNYKICVMENVTGYIKVNANNEEEALDKVQEMLDCDYFVDLPNAKVRETETNFEVVK